MLYHIKKQRFLTRPEEAAFRELARDGLVDLNAYTQEREGIYPETWLGTITNMVNLAEYPSKQTLVLIFNEYLRAASQHIKGMTFQELLDESRAVNERDLILSQARQLRGDLNRLINAIEAEEHPLRPAAKADPKSYAKE